MFKNDLQAVLLAAGRGSRLTELGSNSAKCLLLIGNKPMIWYPINMLHKAKYYEIIVVIQDSQEDAIVRTLNEFKFDPPVKFDFCTIPHNKDLGTADSLRIIKDKLKKDILVISSDVVSDFNLSNLIDIYRLYNPTVTSLINCQHLTGEDTMVPGRKKREKIEKDFIGFDISNNNRIVLLNSEAGFDGSIKFSRSMLKKCPSFDIHNDYQDCHLYILKHWCLNYLADKKSISSIKGELIPSLVRKQFRKERKAQQLPTTDEKYPASIISQSNLLHQQIFDYMSYDELELGLLALEPGNYDEDENQIALKSKVPNEYPNSKIKCFGYLLKEGFCVRANTLLGFWVANRKCTSIFRNEKQNRIVVHSKSQIGHDCIVGERNEIGEKAYVKRSVIGNDCHISDKVKITNCIVMDGVKLEEGCSVQGSIICNNVEIGSNAEIKDCVISSGQRVVTLGKFSNEVLLDVDQMMEL